jgi:monoamine oxidase
MTDIIIIGAGFAGLSAALELKALGVPFVVLEAGDAPGGRARTRNLSSGTAIDLGAHWLHGEHNVLGAELERYGLGYQRDEGGTMLIFENGAVREDDGERFDGAIDHAKAERIKSGHEADCPLPDLGKDEAARKSLGDFALMWNGIDPPVRPSAHEFLTDENTPGGLQIEGGMGALIRKMAQEAGLENIHLRTAVCKISEQPDPGNGERMRVQAMDGSVWTAQRVIFTASLGVLKSALVSFSPPLSRDFHEHLAGIAMGWVNKIVIEVDPHFFAHHDIPVDTGLLLLDNDPPHFCHVHSMGQPIIQVYVSGKQAEAIEAFSADDALHYASRLLAPVEMLHGFEPHVVSAPFVSRWVANPYTQGAYSSCLPGAKRSGPRIEGGICFCGDTFDDRFPASVAGAWRSGKAGARLTVEAMATSPQSEEA